MPRYNIAPGQDILAVVEHEHQREAELLRWGLIPSWSNEPKGFINARAETLEQRPSFTDLFQRRRCLIPADGFYEWDKRSGTLRQPYYFQLLDETPFAFAGIWDEWRRNGFSIRSCAIITTTPNELLSMIHDRMPVILPAESHDDWLNPAITPAKLRNLLAPFPSSSMKSHPVSTSVNRIENDDQSLVFRAEPIAESQPMLFE